MEFEVGHVKNPFENLHSRMGDVFIAVGAFCRAFTEKA